MVLPTHATPTTEHWKQYGSINRNNSGFEEHLALLECDPSLAPIVSLADHSGKVFHGVELHHLTQKPFMRHPDDREKKIHVQGLRLRFPR